MSDIISILMLRFVSMQSLRRVFIASLLASAGGFFLSGSRAQAEVTTPSGFSCAVSQCTMNQSMGTSSSVGVGVTSSFGVNSSAQSTSNYNASSSASLVLNTFNGDPAGQLGYNTSIQAIGKQASDSPISVTINSETVQAKTKDGSSTQTYSDKEQAFNAKNFTENGSTASSADFTAEGFGAMQDLRFKGAPDPVSAEQVPGSTFAADVIKILDKANAPELGTGNANAGAETRTRFQADITTSNFVNAFVSAF
jgi:hypothetical protein